MTIYNRYRLFTAITAICIVAMLVGLRNILQTRSPDGVAGAGLLFGGCAIGVVSLIIARYYRQKATTDIKTQQQVAVETLAKLAEQNRKK